VLLIWGGGVAGIEYCVWPMFQFSMGCETAWVVYFVHERICLGAVRHVIGYLFKKQNGKWDWRL
jgi:hypothetical protein